MAQPCPVSDAQPLSRRARSVRRAQKWPPRAPNRKVLTALDPWLVMAKMVSVPSGTWLRLLEMPSSRNASSNSFPTGGVFACIRSSTSELFVHSWYTSDTDLDALQEAYVCHVKASWTAVPHTESQCAARPGHSWLARLARGLKRSRDDRVAGEAQATGG